jgi:hypothetical protein
MRLRQGLTPALCFLMLPAFGAAKQLDSPEYKTGYPTGSQVTADSGAPMSETPAGHIEMFPAASWTAAPSQPWKVVVPAGLPTVDCTNTESQCGVEAWAYAAAHGLSIDLYACGQNTTKGGTYPCGSTVFPYLNAAAPMVTGPLVQRYIHAHGVNLTFGTTVTGTGLTIDTILDGGYFKWDGQIGYAYNAPTTSSTVVLIKPTTPAPVEAGAALANGEIYLAAVEMGSGPPSVASAGSVVSIDASAASPFADRMEFGELNGGGPSPGAIANSCLKITGASGLTGFVANHVIVRNMHNCVNGIVNGSDLRQANYSSNRFLIQNAELVADLAGTKGIVFDEYGQNNKLTLLLGSNGLGAYDSLVKFENRSGADAGSGAIGDSIDIYGYGFSAPAIIDGTGGRGLHQWKLNGQTIRENRGTQIWDYSPAASCIVGSALMCIMASKSTNADGVATADADLQTTLTLTMGAALPTGYTWYCGPAMTTDASKFGHQSDSTSSTVTFTFPSPLKKGERIVYSGCHGLPSD